MTARKNYPEGKIWIDINLFLAVGVSPFTPHTSDQFRALKTAVILVLLGRTHVDTQLEQVTRVNPKFWRGL